MPDITEMDRLNAIFEDITEWWLDFIIDETKKELRIIHRDHATILIKYTEIKTEI